MPNRTIVYIDGFNLYFGLIDQGWKRFLWLNLVDFSKSIIPKTNKFIKIKYFTSIVKGNEDKVKRQKLFIRANESLKNISFYYGQYKNKDWKCNNCHHINKSPTEKKTDVNIATHMLIDAFQDNFDTAVLISGDSDLSPPITAITKLFPEKFIIVAFPPKRITIDLKKVASSYINIFKKNFSRNQLPSKIKLKNGKFIYKPSKW